MRIPARRALWLGGVGLLDPFLRRRLRVDWSIVDEAQLRTLGVFSRGRCSEPVGTGRDALDISRSGQGQIRELVITRFLSPLVRENRDFRRVWAYMRCRSSATKSR